MKKAFVLTLFICGYVLVNAQLSPVSPTRPSPNAASLGQYGEVPVSLFTGTPQVDIPLYTIKTDFVNFPITLSYHAGGFRPDVHPSWTGLGWSLNAGGAITRTVQHLPDEYEYVPGGTGLNYTGMGYYYSRPILAASNWNTPAGNYVDAGIVKDRAPDIFSFNFLGMSGKFFLDHNGNWKVQSDRPLQVIFDPVDFKLPFIYGNCNCLSFLQRKTFNKFVIVDDKGVRYTFGTDNAVEYSVGMTPKDISNSQPYDYPSNTMATSWFLISIKPPAGTEITLTYERGPYQSSLSYYQYSSGCTSGDVGGSAFLSRWGMYGGYSNGLSGSITSPVYLTSIDYHKDNLTISFIKSKSNELKYPWSLYMEILRDQYGTLPPSFGAFLGFNMTANIPYFAQNPSEATPTPSDPSTKFIWLKLDRIEVKHRNDVNSHDYPSFALFKRKKVQFNYTENSSERLKLNSITVTGGDDLTPQLYNFTYDPVPLPGYATEISDHWGFSNGNVLTKTSSQTYTWFNNLNTYRAPTATGSLKGMLKEISYPTGGKSVFYYESHDYRGYVHHDISTGTAQVMAENAIAGGARIKKIETFDGMGNKTWKDYYYVTDFNPAVPGGTQSSGILERKPKYEWTINIGGFFATIKSSASIVPVSSTSSGRHIGYTNVVERNQDGSYKTYSYTNHDLGHKDIGPVTIYNGGLIPVVSFSSTEFERGKPLEEKTYSSANRLLHKKVFAYQRIAFTADNFVRTVHLDYTVWCVGANDYNSFPAMTANYNYAHYFLPNRIKDYAYDDANRELLTETVNEYDTYGNITKQTQQQSDGGIDEARFTYAYNYPAIAVFDAMKTRNMISQQVTADKYKGTTFLESVKYNYDFFTTSNFIAVSNVQYKKGAGAYETRFSYNQYDQWGNILEIQKGDGIKESFIYGYGSRWPVASVTGVSYSTAIAAVNASIISWPNGNAQMQTELNNLRNLPNSLVKTATFNFYGDVESQTDFSGKTVKYEYDTWGRLAHVRDFQNNVLKKYDYQVNSQISYPYTNTVQTQTLHPVPPCPPNYTSLGVSYTVPAGKHGSFVSVADANQKAMNEMNTTGQAYANANAICQPYFLFTPCCSWNCGYSNFTLTGTGQVNFTLGLSKTGSTSAYGQIGTLSGALFLPSANRTVNTTVITGSGTFYITIYPTGEVSIMGSSITGIIQISGTYDL